MNCKNKVEKRSSEILWHDCKNICGHPCSLYGSEWSTHRKDGQRRNDGWI